MNTLFAILIFAGLTGLFIRSGMTKQPRRAMPPGFHLACHADGRFVAVYDNYDIVLEPYQSFAFLPSTWRRYSKYNAVERAWGQYDHQQKAELSRALPPSATQQGFTACDTL